MGQIQHRSGHRWRNTRHVVSFLGQSIFRSDNIPVGTGRLERNPLCDQDGADATSSFGDDNTPPSDVDVVVNVILRNGSPTDIDDPGDLYRVPLAPVWIFGAGQIWERMEVELSFVGRAGGTSMTLPGPGRKSRTLDTSPTPQALSGTWVGGYLCEGCKPDNVFRHSANILPA